MVKLIEIIRANDKSLNRLELVTKIILFSLITESYKFPGTYPTAFLMFADIENIDTKKLANELQVVTANKTANYFYDNFQYISKNYQLSEVTTSFDYILKIIHKELKND